MICPGVQSSYACICDGNTADLALCCSHGAESHSRGV